MARPDPYRFFAAIYDRVVEPMERGVRRRSVELIAPQPTWDVLDVGCGTGTGMVPYVEAGCTVVGVDVSEAMLARARERHGATVDLHLTDGDTLPFEDGRFDLVTMSMVLHEIPAAERADVLREMTRVTAPGGRLLITEFRFGTLRGVKGRALRILSWVIERISGHYNGYRTFRASDGVPGVATDAGLAIETEKVVAGGNVAIFVL